MNRFEIRCGDAVLGYSDFEFADESMGVRLGRFIPASSYAQFQSHFAQEQQAAETLALPLGIFHSGMRIPTGWVRILDYSADLGDDAGFEISAHLPDYDSYKSVFEGIAN